MRASLFIVVSVLLLADAAHAIFGWRGGAGAYKNSSRSQSLKSSYVGENGNYPSREKISNSTDSKYQARTRRSLGISAWGIIGIIVGVISLTTVAYYAFQLYPYLCKKQSSYYMIELTDVV